MTMNSSRAHSDVIIIGAGLSGICAGIQLQSKFKNATFEIFGKGNDIGGTWSKNTYPNLSCDIPSQLYSYSFAPNPDWSTTYASQPEMLAYIKRIAHTIRSRIHLNQECVSAQWLEDEDLWRVEFLDRTTNEAFVRHSRVLFTAVGFLDIPKGPESITNIQEFGGGIFHSSHWDHEVDFEGKDVVVVGNGASANQFVPWLLKNTGLRSLVQVVQSAQWVAPKENHPIGKAQKWVLRNIPLSETLYRWWLAMKLDLAFVAFKDSIIGRYVRSALEASLVSYIEKTAPSQYRSILVPTYAFGAKRAILDHGYLASLHNPKAKLIKSQSLTVVGANRIADENGIVYPADVIILANGFKTAQLLTPMAITGLDGLNLRDLWERGPGGARAYMGVMMSGFPNLFLLTGPNTLPSGHSTLLGIENSVTYILRLLEPLLGSQGLVSLSKIEVKKDAEDAFNRLVERRMKGLVYTSNVSTWYIDQRTRNNHLVWPGSQLEFWWSRCVKMIRWADFVLSKKKTT